MSDPRGSVARGVGLAIVLHSLQLAIIPFTVSVSLVAWGATQFLYLGPAAWFVRRRGETETFKGILIVAGIGVLLNGACDALVMSAGFRID